jgi:hypothetical protein
MRASADADFAQPTYLGGVNRPKRPLVCTRNVRIALISASAVLLVLGIAACGGRSSASKTGQNASRGAKTRTGATNTSASRAPARPMRATLVGQNHNPTVNRPWAYTVTLTEAKGRPVSGTVDIEFVFNGLVVGRDTPPTHPITSGRWRDTLKFPATAAGRPLAMRAVVHSALGSRTLDWPIEVKK